MILFAIYISFLPVFKFTSSSVFLEVFCALGIVIVYRSYIRSKCRSAHVPESLVPVYITVLASSKREFR
jgi:hypothetical protein